VLGDLSYKSIIEKKHLFKSKIILDNKTNLKSLFKVVS